MPSPSDQAQSMEDALLHSCLQSYTAAEKDGITGSFHFPPEFPCFSGHFADRPVLPAVAQLAAVRILASQAMKRRLQLHAVQRAKFKSMVGPGETTHIRIRSSQENGLIKLMFKITGKNGNISSGDLLCLDGTRP